MKNNVQKGFTLVELLCVLVILALLALTIGKTITKSVNQAKKELTESQETAIIHASEKWAIDNSNQFDDVDGGISTIGLDVIFVVDVSASMKNDITKDSSTQARKYKDSRMYATIEAVNSSLEVLTANKINQIGFVFYSGRIYNWGRCDGSVSGEGATTECSIIKKVSLTNVDNIGKLSMNSLSEFYLNGESIKVEGGTYTLVGLQQAFSLFHKSSMGRIPVIILLTDGEPSWGRKMDENYPFSMKKSTLGTGNMLDLSSTSNNQMVWSIMRTAYLKQELKNIFVDIATEVTEATKVTSLCITIDELKKEGYLSKNSKIDDELAKNTYIIISENAATNQYVFSIAKTDEQKQQCQSLLAE